MSLLICSRRNLDGLERLAQPDWLATDVLSLCGLPLGHDGLCHWRVPHNIRGDHPDRDRLIDMAHIAHGPTGMAGRHAVDAAWAAAGLIPAADNEGGAS